MYKILLIFLILFFTGCLKKEVNPINKKIQVKDFFYIYPNFKESEIEEAVNEIANQLLSNIKTSTQKNYKIIMTSIVNLDNLSKTSTFGRVLSEALIDELHIRKFHVLDFRTQDLIIVNKNGEFSLTRDQSRLTDEIPYGLILVGTYSKLSDNKVLINIRIVDNNSFDVLSTAKISMNIKNCKLIDNCPKITNKKIIKKIEIEEDK